MIFKRNSLQTVVLVVLIGKLGAQDGAEDYSSFLESDYSGRDQSEPIQEEHVDFSNFYPTPNFDFYSASSNNKLKEVPRDYFEKEPELKPGPSYISHRIPVQYEQEIDNLKKIDEAGKETQYNPKYTQARITPYQKYSFKPAITPEVLKVLEETAPTAYNPSYSKIQKGTPKCVKVNKKVTYSQGKFDKQPMTCYVCKDAKTGGNYEECTYSSVSKPVIQGYITTKQVRNKREDTEAQEEEEEIDPYEEIKQKSHEYYSKPSDFEKDFYKAPDFSTFSEEYNYDPKTFNEAEAEEKSYSERQSEELVKKGENCVKEIKDGATCIVCKNPKDGGNYQQCSYESEPQEKKYAYVRERKYNGNEPEEEKSGEESSPKSAEINERSNLDDEVENIESKEENVDGSEKIQEEPENNYDQFDSKYLSEAVEEPQKVEQGPQQFKASDDYHRQIFPDESKQEQKKYYFDDSKKDVDKVLEEFTKKDRKNCKHVYKKGMSCYLCLDKKGVKQEECMYVSESKPKSSHVVYHQLEKVKDPENITEAESQTQKPLVVKRTRILGTNPYISTSTTQNPLDNVKEASEKSERKVKREANKADDPQPEFNIYDEGGYFSSETKPVYSKKLGVSLPKYVVDKSEDEIDFDRSVRGNIRSRY